MTDKTLRALAKDYANGVLDKESYRKARDELLQGILSGKIPVVQIDYRPPINVQDLDTTQEKTAIQVAPPRKPQPSASENEARPTTEFVPPAPKPRPRTTNSPLKLILITTVIAAICVVIIVAVFTSPDNLKPETNNEPIADPLTQNDITSIQQIGPGQTLIEEFLAQNNWADDNLQQFKTNWNNLSYAEQSEALASPAKTQLANAINRQLSEERALIGLGDTAAVISRQHSLVNFASDVGINDSRITVQDIDENLLESTTQTEPEIKIDPVDSPATESASDMEIEPVATNTTEVAIESTAVADTEITTADEKPAPETIVAETTVPDPKPVAPVTEKIQAPVKPDTEKTTTINKHACRASLAKQRQPYCRDTIDGTGKGPTLVVIPGGKFIMGGEKPHELPTHEVVIPKPFAIAVNEITRGEFEQYCTDAQKNCPQQPWADKEYPVVNVTWNDAVAYAEWLSQKTGNQYRLPSESEWEYAARARTKTKYPFGEEILITDAVFSGIKPLTSPLPRSDRSVNRNKFRLYHMVGNVREWVLDTWSDNYNNNPADGTAHISTGSKSRVVRGGSYADNADALRSGARASLLADSADTYTGFRVMQELAQ